MTDWNWVSFVAGMLTTCVLLVLSILWAATEDGWRKP